MDYAAIAERHWKQFRPKQYAQMSEADRRTLFEDLGRQVQEQITASWPALAGPEPPGESSEAKTMRHQSARLTAEAAAVRELLTPGPESQDPVEHDPWDLSEEHDTAF